MDVILTPITAEEITELRDIFHDHSKETILACNDLFFDIQEETLSSQEAISRIRAVLFRRYFGFGYEYVVELMARYTNVFPEQKELPREAANVLLMMSFLDVSYESKPWELKLLGATTYAECMQFLKQQPYSVIAEWLLSPQETHSLQPPAFLNKYIQFLSDALIADFEV